jgi:ElaB/YqjD/DUF883 family membrane-anchored ribosome-binding protein
MGGLKKMTSGDTKKDIQRSRRPAMAKERDINDILEDKVDKFRERVEENVDKFRDRVDDVRERLEGARVKGEEAWRDVVKFTQKHPGQALGVAAVIGAALGILFFRRDRD